MSNVAAVSYRCLFFLELEFSLRSEDIFLRRFPEPPSDDDEADEEEEYNDESDKSLSLGSLAKAADFTGFTLFYCSQPYLAVIERVDG